MTCTDASSPQYSASPQPFIRCERFYILGYLTGMYFVKRLRPYPWTGGKRSFLGKYRIPTTLCELRVPVDVKAGMQLLQSAVPLRGDVRRNARWQCKPGLTGGACQLRSPCAQTSVWQALSDEPFEPASWLGAWLAWREL